MVLPPRTTIAIAAAVMAVRLVTLAVVVVDMFPLYYIGKINTSPIFITLVFVVKWEHNP